MKKEIPLMIVFGTGLFMAVQFFVPHSNSEYVYEYMLDWTIIIGIFALALGIWSFIRVNTEKIRHKKENWPYAVLAMVGLFAMILFGTSLMSWLGAEETGLQAHMFRQFFNYIMIPIHSTMYALLAFFIASAAFRAFRAHSSLATVLLLSALVLMLRFNPYLGPLGV